MLQIARATRVSRFVLASSISAYEWYPGTKFNPPDYMPVDERHPCRPKDMYSVSKYMQELPGRQRRRARLA
jgi:nucleoside-diphosphate-sugar epimerase